jgi:hypothetical protein
LTQEFNLGMPKGCREGFSHRFAGFEDTNTQDKAAIVAVRRSFSLRVGCSTRKAAATMGHQFCKSRTLRAFLSFKIHSREQA